jgi:hypothetical protein
VVERHRVVYRHLAGAMVGRDQGLGAPPLAQATLGKRLAVWPGRIVHKHVKVRRVGDLAPMVV